ncbi:MarR family transcriptional regulator [Lentzea sp. NBRC 102530]|uniref:MarR family winged helix-turn-helix transcriptional regulator n=1 Tax=Lentzea sp. NBRC 102530 TaxID=3032201 RepID=UPI0024A2DBBD|nr:MarR family transcriptional regulator [Lentzea sp. NBRC 102530]GLY54139.1 MarR family transcriptional regulator [Lentzea sp. NBRC 102530]
MTEPVALNQRLRVLVGRLRRRLQDESSVDDLTAPQASALARLLLLGEPSTASQLAGAERVKPQSMAKTLTALHEQGLIQRAADPSDGRRQLITLTPDGRAAAQGARATRIEWLTDALTQALSESERQVIAEALTLLERVVEE